MSLSSGLIPLGPASGGSIDRARSASIETPDNFDLEFEAILDSSARKTVTRVFDQVTPSYNLL